MCVCVCEAEKEGEGEKDREGREEKEGGREGGRIDLRLLKSCSGFSWSEVCACRRASPVKPPQEELFMVGNLGIF